MTFICYVNRAEHEVPYMEVSPATSFHEARTFARRLLEDRSDGETVDIYFEERLLATIGRA